MLAALALIVLLDFEDGIPPIVGNPSTFTRVADTPDIVFQNAIYAAAAGTEPEWNAPEFGTLGVQANPFFGGGIVLDFVRPVTRVSVDVVLHKNQGVRLSPLDYRFLPGPPPTIDWFRVGEDVQLIATEATYARLTVTGNNMSRFTISPENAVLTQPYYDNIEVTFVPVPAALPLLVSALGGLGLIRRRSV